MKFFNKKASSDLGPGKPRSFFRRMGRDPKVDWSLSIIASFLVAVFFVLLSMSRYLSYYSDIKEQVSISKGKEASIIDTKSLDSVLGRYDDRARLREDLIRKYTGPADPSI